MGLPPLTTLPELDLLAAIVPFQCLARALALARGMVPEQMRYPGALGAARHQAADGP